MWTCTVLLACLAAIFSAHSLPEQSNRYFQAPKEYLHRQKEILQLFMKSMEPKVFQEHSEILKSYKIEEQMDKYEDPVYVKNFLEHQNVGHLFPKNRNYYQLSEQSTNTVRLAFELLKYANDFETFIKTAVYLRKNLQMGVFYYAFCIALEARDDTRGLYFPPRYEIFPNMYVDETVMQQAQDAKIKALESGNREKVIIHANHSRPYDHSHDPETTLRYFTEDVGLNLLNVEFDRRFPAWWESRRYQLSHDRKGELFFHFQRQLLARYYLERLSNNLGDMPDIRKTTALPAFYPHLKFPNGEEVTPRQPFTFLRDAKESSLKEIDYKIYNLWSAIDAGYIFDENGSKIPLDYPHGLNVLGELVYFYGDSPNKKLYGTHLLDILNLLGNLADPQGKYALAPSALMRPETRLRDPLYYSVINKFFPEIYCRFLQKLPNIPKYEDVFLPGLKIKTLSVSDLITYFDDFDVQLTNIPNIIRQTEQDVDVFARLRRLNHSPFSFKMEIHSEKDLDAVVKVYITPKYDRQGRLISVDKRALYSFEIDRFLAKVPTGKSYIERYSTDSAIAVDDPPTFSEMWHKVKAALEETEPLIVEKFARPHGFPQRLLLPKGQEHGMPVDLVVAIYPYQQADSTDRRAYKLDSFPLLGTSYNVKFPDAMPIDYPADRFFRSEYDCDVPNIFTKEVRIFHKTLEEINSVPGAHH